MEKFTDIAQFRSVVHTVKKYYESIESPHLLPAHTFIGTVKLHGTNAGVRRNKGSFYPQSRNAEISVTEDNLGFAKYISAIPEDDLNALFNNFGLPTDDITIYGEWIGKGIQDTVAISQFPDRQWVIFNARINGVYVDFIDYSSVNNPSHSIYNIFEIPYYKVVIDFKNPEQIIPMIEKLTYEVEEECPWGAKFDIKGLGEGIVWVCAARPTDSSLFFKTKGSKHSKSKVRKVATVDIERVNSINALVDVILPNGRLEQGIEIFLNQMKLDLIPENMGHYLQWVGGDVMKEEMDTILGNGFVWKDVQKVVTTRAKEFFFKKMKEF